MLAHALAAVGGSQNNGGKAQSRGQWQSGGNQWQGPHSRLHSVCEVSRLSTVRNADSEINDVVLVCILTFFR